ncbi:MAG: hypothetical protein H7308_05475 [Chthonomonadaceae bacterium]|nr:hypothetical protein [Chthonomonadaceae bacterium]
MASIRVIGVPDGEAPHYIRSAWVGCVLPLDPLGPLYATLQDTEGVLSGTRKTAFTRLFARVKQVPGYSVLVSDALEALALHNPVAAQWWRENVPHLIEANGTLIFEASVCQKLMDD